MAVTSLGTADRVLAFASVGGDIEFNDIVGRPCRWIKNGGGGDITIRDAFGATVILYDGGPGSVEMVAATAILLAGTTATNINVYF